jgi:protein-tyrosine phosphatase
MSLDYSTGSVNFRDVGEFINLILGKKHINEGLLLRGGKTDFYEYADEIGNPSTIMNLRRGADKKSFDATNLSSFPNS